MCVAAFAFLVRDGDPSFNDFLQVIELFWQVCVTRFVVAACHPFSPMHAAPMPECVTDAFPEARCSFLLAVAAWYWDPFMLVTVPKLVLRVICGAVTMGTGEEVRLGWFRYLPFL